MLTEYEVKKEICEIGKILYAKGYVAAKHGNISYKYSENEYFCTPSGVAKMYLTPDKIVKVDAKLRIALEILLVGLAVIIAIGNFSSGRSITYFASVVSVCGTLVFLVVDIYRIKKNK